MQESTAKKNQNQVIPFKSQQRDKITPQKLGIQTLISQGTSFNGDVLSDAGIKIDGHIKGDVKIDIKDMAGTEVWLVIGEPGLIEGSVTAERVVVCGRVYGSVRAKHVVLLPTAKVDGDIFYSILKIPEGSKITGRLFDYDASPVIENVPANQAAECAIGASDQAAAIEDKSAASAAGAPLKPAGKEAGSVFDWVTEPVESEA